MATISPLPREQAAEQLRPVYDTLAARFGKMPNIFGMMAHRPNALSAFLPFMQAVMEENTLEPRYREMAYLKTSMLNGCAY